MDIKKLASIANKLDSLGLTKEADILDSVMTKIAQVATTGVAGATYSEGRQVTPGATGGKIVKFYKAKPQSISEFNEYLGELIKEISEDSRQEVFSKVVVSNPPTQGDMRWGSKTQNAFQEYATAVGFPEAGQNWEAFAKNSNNKYEPTMFGIYKFWEDTISKLDPIADTFERQRKLELEEEARSSEERRRLLSERSRPADLDMARPTLPPSGTSGLGETPGTQTAVKMPGVMKTTEEKISDIKATGYRGYKITNQSNVPLAINKIYYDSSKTGGTHATTLHDQGATFRGDDISVLREGQVEESNIPGNTRIKNLVAEIGIGVATASAMGKVSYTKVFLVMPNPWGRELEPMSKQEVTGILRINLDAVGTRSKNGILEVVMTDDLYRQKIIDELNSGSSSVKLNGTPLSGAIAPENQIRPQDIKFEY